MTRFTGGSGWGRIHLAPLVIFPVALVAIAARALWMNDPRELFMSPISAAMMTAVGYPLASLAIWLACRFLPRLTEAGASASALAGVVTAEVAFWSLIHPWWQRDFSAPFMAILIAAFGLLRRLQTSLPNAADHDQPLAGSRYRTSMDILTCGRPE